MRNPFSERRREVRRLPLVGKIVDQGPFRLELEADELLADLDPGWLELWQAEQLQPVEV